MICLYVFDTFLTYLAHLLLFHQIHHPHAFPDIFQGRPDSPGPEKTKNPWESEGASRRSSISAKPEVLVTTSATEEPANAQAEGGGKMTVPRLMSLLPVCIQIL